MRGYKENHFNRQYYISLYRNNKGINDLSMWLSNRPKFIIQDISPFYADRKKCNFRRIFINTKILLKTSELDGEYQQYLKINPSKIVTLEYILSSMLSNIITSEEEAKEKLKFLKEIIIYMKQNNIDSPIYDL